MWFSNSSKPQQDTEHDSYTYGKSYYLFFLEGLFIYSYLSSPTHDFHLKGKQYEETLLLPTIYFLLVYSMQKGVICSVSLNIRSIITPSTINNGNFVFGLTKIKLFYNSEENITHVDSAKRSKVKNCSNVP